MTERGQRDLPGADAKPLDPEQQARWDASREAMDDLAAATMDGAAEAGQDALARVRNSQLDPETVLNALHVPEDAGRWAADLDQALRRIPDGWGRWISCDKGWYPLVAHLCAQLSAVCPSFTVHQIKEKYGSLCFYFDVPDECADSYDAMQSIVNQAEAASEHICEVCSQRGCLRSTSASRGGWFKTLCDLCAAQLGYQTVPKETT